MAQIFFLAIAFYLGYRLVFNFILPVYKTTKHVRTQFRNMQDNMQNSQQPYNGYQQPRQEPPRTRPEQNRADDYIDFEEVK
jgi:hypothetical protein